MRRIFRAAVLAAFIGLLATIGWQIYGETQTSEATNFDESVGMVQHQTAQMSASIGQTHAAVQDHTKAQREVAEIDDLSELMDRWNPRYSQAKTAYQKFDAAIVLAEEQAEAYFVAQRALTQQFHDDAQRSRAMAQDDADYQLYLKWRDRAHRTRAEARAILRRLEDMDTNLHKLELTAGLRFDASSFKDVPVALTNLEGELAQFSTASDGIRETIGSPFAE